MSTVETVTEQQLADIDLSGYDAEQSKLMEERCILVDGQDNAIGAADKKTCKSAHIPSTPVHRSWPARSAYRPSDGKHQ